VIKHKLFFCHILIVSSRQYVEFFCCKLFLASYSVNDEFLSTSVVAVKDHPDIPRRIMERLAEH
jgi:hypothetical protein